MKRDKLDAGNVALLRRGRHYRIGNAGRLIVGRDEQDNLAIERLAQSGDYVFGPSDDIAGPTALGRGIASEQDVALCCSIVSRYCDLNGRTETAISYKKAGSDEQHIRVAAPITDEELVKIRI
jgi:hypothetical protein